MPTLSLAAVKTGTDAMRKIAHALIRKKGSTDHVYARDITANKALTQPMKAALRQAYHFAERRYYLFNQDSIAASAFERGLNLWTQRLTAADTNADGTLVPGEVRGLFGERTAGTVKVLSELGEALEQAPAGVLTVDGADGRRSTYTLSHEVLADLVPDRG